MKSKYIIIGILIITALVVTAGCLNANPTPAPTPTPAAVTDTNDPVKYSKMEGSFTITSSDFTNNSSRMISKDSNGNELRWVIEQYDNKSITGGTIVIKYYDNSVSAYIPRLYYPANTTYTYSLTETGYDISTNSGGRYRDTLIKGEWAK